MSSFVSYSTGYQSRRTLLAYRAQRRQFVPARVALARAKGSDILFERIDRALRGVVLGR